MTMHSSFFFNDTATTEIYTLSLHDALPIYVELTRLRQVGLAEVEVLGGEEVGGALRGRGGEDGRVEAHEALVERKSTRLNSSHAHISYAVFCLKKKKY